MSEHLDLARLLIHQLDLVTILRGTQLATGLIGKQPARENKRDEADDQLGRDDEHNKTDSSLFGGHVEQRGAGGSCATLDFTGCPEVRSTRFNAVCVCGDTQRNSRSKYNRAGGLRFHYGKNR